MSHSNIRYPQAVAASGFIGDSAAALAARYSIMQEMLRRSAYTDDYSREERDDLRKELSRISSEYENMTGKRLP